MTGITHKIETKDEIPVKQKMRRTPLGFQEQEEKQLNKMLEVGVIRPSTSEWATTPVLVKKKDGSVRWCIDYMIKPSKTLFLYKLLKTVWILSSEQLTLTHLIWPVDIIS